MIFKCYQIIDISAEKNSLMLIDYNVDVVSKNEIKVSQIIFVIIIIKQ